MEGPGSQRMPGLDGLRAWAVLAVVAFHSGALQAGWVGVDLFMALSGFLITGVLVAELDRRQRVALGHFWGRRARRLWPGLLTLVAAVAVVTELHPASWSAPTERETIGALTYTSNWLRLGAHRNYWHLFDAPSAFEHLWSLAIEEQFYLVWPVLLWAVWRRGGRRTALRATVALWLLAAGLQIGLSLAGSGVERLYVGTDTRAPAFLAGALMMLARPMLGERGRARARSLLRPAVLGLVAACVWADGAATLTYRGPLLLISTAGAVAALGASFVAAESRSGLVLTWSPLRMVGRWSYGIYLFHWPIVVLLTRERWPSAVKFVAVMAAATALAALTYETYEDRIRRTRIPLRWLPVAATAGAAVAVLAWSVAVAPGGELTHASAAELTTPLPTAPPASSTAPDSRPTLTRLLVYGDSVMYELDEQFRVLATADGIDAAVRAAPGCTASTQEGDQNNVFYRGLCAQVRNGLSIDVARARPDAALIFLGGTWNPYVWHGAQDDPCSATGQAAVVTDMRALIADLGADGARVFLVVPPRLAGIYADDASAAPCYASAYRQAADVAGATVLDLATQVCPVDADTCADAVHGVRMRHDGLHFTAEGGAWVATWLLQQMQAAFSAA